MQIVALLKLNGTAEAEAPLLARDLGVTAFEAGQLLRGVFPSVVLKTADQARATAVCAALFERGHAATVCTLEDVVSHRTMHLPKIFRLDSEALISVVPQAPEEVVAFGAIRALIRATHTAQVTQTAVEKGRAFSAGRAVLSGGLVLTKSTSKETTAQVTEKEPVLYLFRSAGPPWLLAESHLKYDGLGAALKPGRSENFQTLVKGLRERAPNARFDERLLQFRGAPGSPNTPDTLDLLAQLIAS